MICVSCMNVYSLSWELEKRNVSLHAYTDQTTNKFEDFCIDLNLFLSNINDLNPAFSFITGDFNARPPQWWAFNKENSEEREISFLNSSVGYSHLIDQLTHITKASSSCIDLIFTSNPSFISTSGEELLLDEKCHHNLIYGKISFNAPFPIRYILEVRDYKNTKVANIQLSFLVITGILFSKKKLFIKKLIS